MLEIDDDRCEKGRVENKAQDLLNYNQVCCEFLRELRGDLSQRDLSKKLGYSYNQVGKWEAGFKQFKWSDFFHLCKVLKIPWEEYFRNFIWTFQGEFNPISTVAELSRQLVDQNKELKINSQHILKKWLSGERDPDFADVLEIIDIVPSMLLSFVSLFIDGQNLQSLQGRFKDFQMSINLVHEEPLCVFINAALQLKEYKELAAHSDLILADHCGTSEDNLRRVLGLMTWNQLIKFDGRKYYPSPLDFSFSGLRLAKLRSLTKYVTYLAAEKYSVEPRGEATSLNNPCVSSVRVNALSSEAAHKVMGLVSSFHHLVSQVVREDQDKPKDNVQVILIHSFHSKV